MPTSETSIFLINLVFIVGGKSIVSEINHLITVNLFTTITNANFDLAAIEAQKFVVMAGCDGRQKQREYYAEFAKALPKDAVIHSRRIFTPTASFGICRW